MKILIDVLGADKGCEIMVKGALAALDKYDYLPVFVGPEDEIKSYIPADMDKEYSIIHAPDLISNDDQPALAIRRKKESSMFKAFRALKNDEADGMISTGSTGALLAGATLIIGRIKNVERAAMALVFPGLNGKTVILDVGANMDISPEMMVQFAHMGASYAKVLLDKNTASIGLLNIGTEEAKGNELSKESYALLKESKLNFIGNIEPYDLIDTQADVIVTDGFAGNIALKSVEGTMKVAVRLLKETVDESFMAKLGAGLMLPKIKEKISSLEIDKIGAAPLLGTKKAVFKAHGSSSLNQIESGILQLIKYIENNVISDIERNLED